ncbi:MAG: peptidase M48, partial [Burkholderiales bacterium PBB4]
MDPHNTLRSDLIKSALLAALALFLLPALTYGFVRYAQRADDVTFLRSMDARFETETALSFEERQQRMDFYRARPLSTICANTEPDAQDYREAMCEPWGETWQFHYVRKAAGWALVGGAVLMLSIAGLGALAFGSRKLQYRSFLVGWRLLMVASALAVVLQGFFAVWLSFWVTAFLWHQYYVKLIVVAGLCALGGVAVILSKIFQKVHLDNPVDGEVLTEAQAPLLLRRVKHLAARMRTAAPDHIVAGIDTNFFVTQAPLTVGNKTLTGRSLFMSIPLLRVLSMQEADAVLGHELAHFRGGDTRASALLGPKLQQYDHYVEGMRTGGLTMVVYPFMQLYRMIFQWALSEDSRKREFRADYMAAKLVSPQAIAQSLIKISAYANYRANTENALFESDQQLQGALGIGSKVAQGLYPYAASDDFFDDMRTAHIPHPFDSHPPLDQRMKKVGHVVEPTAFATVVAEAPKRTWADDILDAQDIEDRLWKAYEERFAVNHDMALAYRYEPANDAQLAHVLKYFPPLVFSLRKGAQVEVNFEGILPHDGALIQWEHI